LKKVWMTFFNILFRSGHEGIRDRLYSESP